MSGSDAGFHEKLLKIFPDRYFVFDPQGNYLAAFTSAEGLREFIVKRLKQVLRRVSHNLSNTP
jgi:hypothetical protein